MQLLRARVDRGTACLLVTHEPRFAAWADRAITLRDGRIIDAAKHRTPRQSTGATHVDEEQNAAEGGAR